LELGDQNDLDGIWKLPGGVRARDSNWLPGRLFNSRLAPIARFAVRGAIWYQGESNSVVGEDPRDYTVPPENCNLYSRDGLPASPFCSNPSLLQYDPGLPK